MSDNQNKKISALEGVKRINAEIRSPNEKLPLRLDPKESNTLEAQKVELALRNITKAFLTGKKNLKHRNLFGRREGAPVFRRH